MNIQPFETVICPVCHKPFPKKRRDLGYRVCVNCSTESGVVCVIEGTMDGDGDDTVHSGIHIVTREEARAVEIARGNFKSSEIFDIESQGTLDMSSTDDRDDDLGTAKSESFQMLEDGGSSDIDVNVDSLID